MQIHVCRKNDTVASVAGEYGLPKEILAAENGLSEEDALREGQELIVLLPKRSETVRNQTNVSTLAKELGCCRRALLAANPHLCGKTVVSAGTVISTGFDKATGGASSALGTVFSDTDEASLSRALPYLSYVAVSSVARRDGGCEFLFDDMPLLYRLESERKCALLRIYDSTDGDHYRTPAKRKAMIDEYMLLAKSRGYAGVLLPVHRADPEAEHLFFAEAKREFFGCGLLLLAERDFARGEEDSADATVLLPDGIVDLSFPEGADLRRVILELPGTDEKGAPLSLSTKKAKLAEIGELGCLGVAFDIKTTPVSDYLLYSSMFSFA